MKKAKTAAVSVLILLFLFAPINPNKITISFHQNTHASQEISRNEVWDSDRTISGEIILRPGSMLTIKKGVTINFDAGYIRSDRGFLSIEGTVKEPVKFKNANNPSEERFYSIMLENESVGIFKNAQFSGGGFTFEESVPIGENEFLNKALAQSSPEYLGAVDVDNSYLECQKCEFKDNINAVTIKNQLWEFGDVVVNRSRFKESKDFNVWYDDSKGGLDFQYNWWDGNPEKISGSINVANYAIRGDFHDPVIIIPGIMGSWEKDGQMEIDPIFHTYDDLYAEFTNNSYIPEENLFTFPYEWRDSNADNAEKLKEKINGIKNQVHWPKVDIVAHSMGGLLAREYIESDYYENDVDQLVTVGTPHLGAPKDYVTWEAGEFTGPWGFAFKRIFNHEAEESGYANIFDYIRNRPINSVQELLPIYNYLYEKENDYALRESYPINYPANDFLDNLNSEEKIGLLDELEFYDIIGRLSGELSTISGFNIVNNGEGEMWEHGYPENFWFVLGDRGFVRNYGDGTVPLYSAEASDIPVDERIYLQSEHNALPTDSQQDVLEILTSERPEEKVNEWQIDDILVSLVFSPVDFQIVSPSGKRIGKNFETGMEFNEVEGAYYTGFGANTEFITIPNPENGEYKILTQGMGGGEYKIETAKVTEDSENPEQAGESYAIITGTTEVGKMEEKTIEVTENEVIYNPDETPPIVIITSPEEKEYLNDQIIVTAYSISDETSPNEKIEKVIAYDGTEFLGESIDLSLQHLGEHKFRITATDEAENASEEEITFQNTTNLGAIQNNVGHYWNLGMIKKKMARRYLLRRLNHLESLFDLLEKIKNSKLKPKPKEMAMDALEKIINADIDRLIRKINRRTLKWFDQNIAEFLTESIAHLKIE